MKGEIIVKKVQGTIEEKRIETRGMLIEHIREDRDQIKKDRCP